MGAALNTAGASNAYVLSDRGTWISFKNKGDLVIAVEGDKRLFNQYGVMLVNPAKHPTVKKELGQAFIDWLVSPEGQKTIANYKINGEQLFYPNANDTARDGPRGNRTRLADRRSSRIKMPCWRPPPTGAPATVAAFQARPSPARVRHRNRLRRLLRLRRRGRLRDGE